MRRFNTIIESANPPGINQLWIDKKKLRYFTEGKWHLLGDGEGSAEPPEISDHDTWIINGEDTGKPTRGDKGNDGKAPLLRVTDTAVEYSYDGITWIELLPKSDFNISNNPDEEDITAIDNRLKLKDKVYLPTTFSGLGRVYLRKNLVGGKNVLTQDMINQPNTIYLIQYDYDLDATSITLPSNSTLEFEGGSIINGTLVGNSTRIINDRAKIFDYSIILEGNWDILEAFPEWFGVLPNNESIDSTPFILKCINANINVRFPIGSFYLSECLIKNCKLGNYIKGTVGNTGHQTSRTLFYPIGSNQRFIIKLGGNADFSKPDDESDQSTNPYFNINFHLSGIRFSVPEDKKLVNADSTGASQQMGALCIEYTASAEISMDFFGYSPALYLANSWEVSFPKIRIYGSFIDKEQSAVYFGKCYRTVADANISAITIDNLYGESYTGNLFYIANDANSFDITIKNIALENRATNDVVYRYTDYDDFFNNVRGATKVPTLNFNNCNGINIGTVSINALGGELYGTEGNLFQNILLRVDGSVCTISSVIGNPCYFGGIENGTTYSIYGKTTIISWKVVKSIYSPNISPSYLYIYYDNANHYRSIPITINDTNCIINPDIPELIENECLINESNFEKYCNIVDGGNGVVTVGQGTLGVPTTFLTENDRFALRVTPSFIITKKLYFQDTDFLAIHIKALYKAGLSFSSQFYDENDVLLGTYPITVPAQSYIANYDYVAYFKLPTGYKYFVITTNDVTYIKYIHIYKSQFARVNEDNTLTNFIRGAIGLDANNNFVIYSGSQWRTPDGFAANIDTKGTVIPLASSTFIGRRFYLTNNFKPIYDNGSNKWRESDGEIARISRAGGFASRPLSTSSIPPTNIGFRYFDTINHRDMTYAGDNKYYYSDGYLVTLLRKGTTNQRPTPETTDSGFIYFDTTLNKPFWWTGSAWITYPDSSGSTMAALTFTGAVEATYNGSTPVTVNIPTGGGGTTNYEDLPNKPKIGDVELVGTKTLVQLGIQPAGDYATETYVTEQITAAIGTINTALDNINGEVI